MSARGVGRVEQDKAGGMFGTGADTVFTNNKKTIIEGSVVITPPNKGDVILPEMVEVYAENKRVATQGSVTVRGYSLQRASENVFVGNNTSSGSK